MRIIRIPYTSGFGKSIVSGKGRLDVRGMRDSWNRSMGDMKTPWNFFPSLEKGRLADLVARVLVVAILTYASAKASLLSITHDEAVTYLRHVVLPVSSILSFDGPMKANNHLLNTLLAKGFVETMGLREITLRMPALIGAALYTIGAYKVLRLFCRGWVFPGGLVLLLGNPFLVDFLSLSRGYALGLGCMMWGVYFLVLRVTEPGQNEFRHSLCAMTCFAVAALANLSFLNVYLGAFCTLGTFETTGFPGGKAAGKPSAGSRSERRRKPPSRRARRSVPSALVRMAGYVGPSALFLLLIYWGPIVKMRETEALYFGGTSGFWNDTVMSLVQSLLYGKNIPGMDLAIPIAGLVLVTLVAGAIGMGRYFYRKPADEPTARDPFPWLYLFLVACAVAISLQHFLLGVRYVTERAAIYFIPLYGLFLVALWGYLDKWDQGLLFRRCSSLLLATVVLLLSVHFLLCANYRYVHTWKYDANTKEAMEWIAGESRGNRPFPGSVRLGVNWLFEPSVNFYIFKNRLTWIRFVDRSGPFGNFDYYYLLEEDKEKLDRFHGIRVEKRLADSGTYLARPNPGLLPPR